MNAPANFDLSERTAEIVTFVARHQLPLSGVNILPGLGGLINGGPQIAAAKAKLREIAARQKAEIERHQPLGSVGAAKVPPEIVWSRNERVVIDLRIGETERAVDETEAALIDSDRGLYRRGGLIVSTGFDKMQTWDGRTIEVQIIEERSNYALLEDIEAVASFEKYSPKAKKTTKLPPPLAAGAHTQAADDAAAPAQPRQRHQLPDHQSERRTHRRAGLLSRYRHPVRPARRQVPAASADSPARPWP